MTEIPEHLLKRSRERRSAIGQGDDGGDASSGAAAEAPASATPATTSAAAAPAAAAPSGPAARVPEPAAPAAPPPKPDPVYVTAAKTRKKIPFWAMATLSLMPVWAFMYVRAVTEGEEVVEGPIGHGAAVYSNCASCHGAGGGGGVGYAFDNGAVLDTFPVIQDQLRYVYFGTEGYNAAGVEVYGNPDRPGGAHVTGALNVMPAFGPQLSQADIVAVVCHERYTLGGADPTSDEFAEEYETWCAEEAPAYAAIEAGEFDLTSPDPATVGTAEVIGIGPEPIPGSSGAEG